MNEKKDELNHLEEKNVRRKMRRGWKKDELDDEEVLLILATKRKRIDIKSNVIENSEAGRRESVPPPLHSCSISSRYITINLWSIIQHYVPAPSQLALARFLAPDPLAPDLSGVFSYAFTFHSLFLISIEVSKFI